MENYYMIQWIKTTIIKRVLVGYLDKALALIPANGRKTLVGVLIILLSLGINALQGHPILSLLSAVLTVLQGMDHATFTPEVVALISGAVTTLIGLFHKAVKLAKSKVS